METELVAHYQSAGNRLLLLDYDGTLMELKPTPPEAKPTAEVLTLLEQLTADPRNTVVIISGRPRETLDAWLGDLPLHFAAEHGHWRKVPAEGWHATTADDGTWKQLVGQLMHNADTACPGASTEEKTSALAWHYRNAADPAQADQAARQLLADLHTMKDQLDIRIMDGNKVIEVQASGMDKGAAAKLWLDNGKWDFVFAAGDDVTDEDLFAAMPDTAYTVKVGSASSKARMRVATQADMRIMLQAMLV